MTTKQTIDTAAQLAALITTSAATNLNIEPTLLSQGEAIQLAIAHATVAIAQAQADATQILREQCDLARERNAHLAALEIEYRDNNREDRIQSAIDRAEAAAEKAEQKAEYAKAQAEWTATQEVMRTRRENEFSPGKREEEKTGYA